MSGNEMTGGEALARMIQAFHGGPMFGLGGFQLLRDPAKMLPGVGNRTIRLRQGDRVA